MYKILPTLLFVMAYLVSAAQYNIDIKLKNYDNDTIIIGNYYADKTLVKDTLYSKGKGEFNLSGTDTLEQGVYLILLQPNNNYAQFVVNDQEKEFTIKWDTTDPNALEAKGSEDNAAFYTYLNYLADMRPEADDLRSQINEAEDADKEAEDTKAKLEALDVKVKAYQADLIANAAKNPITSMFVNSTKQVNIPEFEGSEDEVQFKKYVYYKHHYFDHIELDEPATLRTPFLHDRIDYYMDKLTPNDPDSIILSIDYLLAKMKPAPQTFRYYTSYLTNKYANNKIVGMDAVYVHMVDTYYSSGQAEWVKEETLAKMKENANNIRPILIGKTFPAITTYLEDGTPVEINKIESPYTIVMFWAHTCGHCTKSMPDVVEFYDEYQSQGVTLVSVCTKGGEKTKPCMEAVPGKNMEKFINTFDEYQRYRRKVYINTTPKIFILDKDKEIIIKDIPAKELKNVMKNVIEIDAKRALEEQKQ